MKTDITDYRELTDEQLSKLNGKRLLGLKKKMNTIIGKINYNIDESDQDEEMKAPLKRAKAYHKKIVDNLDQFGNID
jgi:hypothetical protein